MQAVPAVPVTDQPTSQTLVKSSAPLPQGNIAQVRSYVDAGSSACLSFKDCCDKASSWSEAATKEEAVAAIRAQSKEAAHVMERILQAQEAAMKLLAGLEGGEAESQRVLVNNRERVLDDMRNKLDVHAQEFHSLFYDTMDVAQELEHQRKREAAGATGIIPAQEILSYASRLKYTTFASLGVIPGRPPAPQPPDMLISSLYKISGAKQVPPSVEKSNQPPAAAVPGMLAPGTGVQGAETQQPQGDGGLGASGPSPRVQERTTPEAPPLPTLDPNLALILNPDLMVMYDDEDEDDSLDSDEDY